MKRKAKLLIEPSLRGLVVSAALAWLLATIWQALAIDVENLSLQYYASAMDDLDLYDAYMREMRSGTMVMLWVVGAAAWATAATWFLACLGNPVAEVGAVRRMRSRWWTHGLLGLLLALLLATYLAIAGTELSSLIQFNPLLSTLLFLVPFFAVIYYAVALLCTHRVYLAAIPLSRWRKW